MVGDGVMGSVRRVEGQKQRVTLFHPPLLRNRLTPMSLRVDTRCRSIVEVRGSVPTQTS